MENRGIYLDDSILFSLLYPDEKREIILSHLDSCLREGYSLTTSVYSLSLVENFFRMTGGIEKFFEFFTDIDTLFDDIFPFHRGIYPKAYQFQKLYELDWNLSVVLVFMESHGIRYLYTSQYQKYKEKIENQFPIIVYFPEQEIPLF